MDSDSPWEEDPQIDHVNGVEWTRITSEFTNSGYREGIIAGKEASLQAGFDAGFANGVPLGREIGNLRGTAAAIRSLLSSHDPDSVELKEIRNISSDLSTIQLSDIAPRDIEGEEHDKQHVGTDDGDKVQSIDPGEEISGEERRTIEDVMRLKERLIMLSAKLGLSVLA